MKKTLALAAALAVGALSLSACSSPETPVPVASLSTASATATPTPEPDTIRMDWDAGEEDTPVEEVTVTRVIDGDTIETNVGTVRIIGFDTPERGECGYDEATEGLDNLLANSPVYLVTDPLERENTDMHGRLLRHVVVEQGSAYSGISVGTVMIGKGLAKPRYNSTDGYGKHSLEETYSHDADNAYDPPYTCEKPEPKATPEKTKEPSSSGNEVNKPNARPGQYCAAADAGSYTNSKYGRLVCKEASDGRYRWAHA